MIEALTLVNLSTNEEININMTNGEYWLGEVDLGQTESDIHTFKYINQIGESVYNTSIEPRSISIQGWIAGWDENKVKQQKIKLNHFINPKQTIRLIANDYSIEFYPETSVVYSPTYEDNNNLICKFLISGFCPYPLFTDKDEHFVSVAYTKKLFHFPLIIPKDEGIMFGIRQPSLIAEVDNNGDFDIGYIIEFRAYGKVVNPILTDIGSQEFIEITKTLNNGETVIVDTREGQRQIRGILNNTESNYFKYRSLDSSWLSLAVGTNYLRYNAEEGITNLEVYIRFNPGYLEIDQ